MTWQCEKCGARWTDRPVGDCYQCDLRAGIQAAGLRPPCETGCRPVCSKCGRDKAPVGRSIPPAMAGGLCDWDCPAYYTDQKPCDLWPGEKREVR